MPSSDAPVWTATAGPTGTGGTMHATDGGQPGQQSPLGAAIAASAWTRDDLELLAKLAYTAATLALAYAAYHQ